jgi:hypothetical protein
LSTQHRHRCFSFSSFLVSRALQSRQSVAAAVAAVRIRCYAVVFRTSHYSSSSRAWKPLARLLPLPCRATAAPSIIACAALPVLHFTRLTSHGLHRRCCLLPGARQPTSATATFTYPPCPNGRARLPASHPAIADNPSHLNPNPELSASHPSFADRNPQPAPRPLFYSWHAASHFMRSW